MTTQTAARGRWRHSRPRAALALTLPLVLTGCSTDAPTSWTDVLGGLGIVAAFGVVAAVVNARGPRQR